MSLGKRLTTFSQIVTISLVMVVVLNLVIFIAIHVRREFREEQSTLPGPVSRYGMDRFMTPGVYDGYTKDEILTLLNETYQPLIHESYTMYREQPRSGDYVNIAEQGFRHIKNQAAYPPPQDDFNVFVFGGSTTFGYGVADWDTIASHLQEELRKAIPRTNVYNFGRGFYYSTQERILFELLLSRGLDMDLAVFIDGVNEKGSQDQPSLHKDLQRGFQQAQADWEELLPTPRLLGMLVNRTPMGRLAMFLQSKTENTTDQSREPAEGEVMPSREAQENGKGTVERYLTCQRQIRASAQAFGVDTLFVWQPANWLDYDQQYHVFSYMNSASEFAQKYAYEAMREYIRDIAPSDMLDLSSMQREERRPLYVDGVHYNAYLSEKIAKEIAEFLLADRQVAVRGE